MQKKILSAVLALSLVGSASVAFAGGYWGAPTYDVDVHASDSFNYESDNDGYDIDVKDSFNRDYSSTYNSSSRLDLDAVVNVTKDSNNTETKVKQGNYSKAHIMVNQAGTGGTGGSGDVISLDYSINYSAIDSYNTNDSYNTTKSKSSSYTNIKDIDIHADIHDSFNKSYSRKSMSFGCHGGCPK
jgi:hypothetical protein